MTKNDFCRKYEGSLSCVSTFCVLRDGGGFPQTQLCPVHGDPLRMWCRDCVEPACGLCVFDKHPMPLHTVEPAILYVSNTKKELLNHLDRLSRQTRSGIVRNKKAFHACETQLLKHFRDDRELLQLDGTLKNLQHLVESATGVRTLYHVHRQLRWIQTQMWNSTLIRDDDEDGDQNGASASAQSRRENLNTVVESLGLQVGLENGRRARLEWDQDRLLVCATPESSAHPRPVLQVLCQRRMKGAGQGNYDHPFFLSFIFCVCGFNSLFRTFMNSIREKRHEIQSTKMSGVS